MQLQITVSVTCKHRTLKTLSWMKSTSARMSFWPRACSPMERFIKLSARRFSGAEASFLPEARPSLSLSHQAAVAAPDELQTLHRKPLAEHQRRRLAALVFADGRGHRS